MGDLDTRMRIFVSEDSALQYISTGDIAEKYGVEVLESGNRPNPNYDLDKTQPIGYLVGFKVREGVGNIEQLIIAWKSRLQPIIVTTLTTVFWVLPLALQDEFWAWLGFTIIFWLFVWSFMTLVVVPILYHFLVLRTKIKNNSN